MKKKVLPGIMFFFCLHFGYGQGGKLDPSFGKYGIVTAENYLNPTGSRKTLTLPDGSMYLIHYVGIEKRGADGYRDFSYGKRGFSTPTKMNPSDAAFQSDGKIVVAGSSENDFKVERFNTDGSLDSSFSNDGIQTTDFASGVDFAQGVAIQKDGKIVVGGYAKSGHEVNDFAIARYNKDGSPDNSFSGNGKLTTGFKTNSSINSLAIQDDGKIVAVGSIEDRVRQNPQFALARYNADGSLDNTFSKDGTQTTDFGTDQPTSASLVSIEKDGKIVVAGSASSGLAMARYKTNGTPDSSFSNDGKRIEAFTHPDRINTLSRVASVSFQKDGKIVVSFNISYSNSEEGHHEEFAIVRFNTDGSPDKSFSDDGTLTIPRALADFYYATSLAIQTDGKIVVAGSNSEECYVVYTCPTYLVLARFNIDGVPDNSFGLNGEVNGRVTNYTGTIIQNFTSTAIQKDGKIVAVGTTIVGYGVKDYGPINDFAVTRYNPEGTLDTTFSRDGVQTTSILVNDFATSVAIQANGKIVVVGYSLTGQEYNENSFFSIVRYNSDGSLDSTFNGTGKRIASFDRDPDWARSSASSVAIQPDGKIVVAGTDDASESEEDEGASDFALIRYNSDGTLDSTFSDDGKLVDDVSGGNDWAFSVAIQPDSKIVVGGSYSLNGKRGLALARYNMDGSPDNTFAGQGKQTTYFDSTNFIFGTASSLAIQKDGKILLAGSGVYPSDPKSMLVRYNTDGSLDNTFSDDGKQTTSFGYASSIALQDDGKIVAGGRSERISSSDFTLMRFSINGSIDSTFGNNGKLITNVSDGSDAISEIEIKGNALYAVGSGQYLDALGVIAKYLLDDKRPTPPTVSLTHPTNNRTYLAPANIWLSASASDADGTITQILWIGNP